MDTGKAIEPLLEEPDRALMAWYQSVLGHHDDDLILTGAPRLQLERIREVFAGWAANNRPLLQRLICRNLRYRAASPLTKEVGGVAIATLVAEALAGDHAVIVDPVATAAVLVSTRYLDTLCPDDEGTTEGGDPSPTTD